MEYIILLAIISSYLLLSSGLTSIKSKIDNKPKTKINLKELIGKKVEVYLADDNDISLEGELVSFDKEWFEIKVVKKNTEIYYKRIEKIKSITLK